MSCKVASLSVIEDFSHFEGVSPLPFPETYPSWPVETKSESLPGLDHGHESIETPVLLSYSSVKEPPALFSFGSGKEPPAFLSYVSGKDSDMSSFASELAITISGTFSSLPPTLSVASFSQSSFSQSSSAKPSVTGSLFSETLLLPVVKQEPKKETKAPKEDDSKRPFPQPIIIKQPTTNNCSSAPMPDITDNSSSSEQTSSSDSVTSSPDSSSSFTLLSLLDGDNHTSLTTSERKTKTDRKTTKRDREEKKQPQKRGRKKRNSDDSDGSEFDSNDSGCWAESKKERNKKAASNYRKRRKMYVGELEAKVASLTEKNAKDRANVLSMTCEIQSLKERVESLEGLLALHNVEVPKRKSSTSSASCNTSKTNKRAKN